ncbi:hypothetical protein AN958_03901 [Leucoagaricus sp. SymC.cos]|nr:hypothetical protein AN958_03901 [Leucoagaricus sp. SymC.cos]
MTARAMGVPVPRILLYASLGHLKGGYILMTKVPGDTLWHVQESCSDEVDDILAEVGECLQQMQQSSGPYGRAICGIDGQTLYNWFGPYGNCDRLESPEKYHDLILKCAFPVKFPVKLELEDEFASACKIMERDSSYRAVFAHGDLHLSNIIVKDGRFIGIIDWEAAAWFPEYWDFVNPMSMWPKAWNWAREWMYSVPGGEEYDQERESWTQKCGLAGYAIH